MNAHLDGCLAAGSPKTASSASTSTDRRGRSKKGIDISKMIEFAPRQRVAPNGTEYGGYSAPRPPVRRSNKHSKRAASRAIYSRETFVQANCQFLVSLGGDYSSFVAEPDRMVDWDLIQEVS